jgi:hypothetical protein
MHSSQLVIPVTSEQDLITPSTFIVASSHGGGKTSMVIHKGSHMFKQYAWASSGDMLIGPQQLQPKQRRHVFAYQPRIIAIIITKRIISLEFLFMMIFKEAGF